jgi:alkanesulfonate monooxygenase SsuD/methylene tetrahydromethanopterin reductase-like flavin-dependent oxidoreductase (luciferase family)
MEFGLFSLLSRRSADQTAAAIVQDALETVKVAEQAGFTTAWFPEHHYSNYSIAPSPLMMCAYCAPVTSRIKLGTAIVIGSLYQPARLLSEVAFVDAMTGGRLVLGVGSGYQPHEFRRFDIRIEDSPAITAEVLDILEGGLAAEAFEYKGKYFNFPHTWLSMPTTQRPHPEIWLAGNTPTLQMRAAVKDYPLVVTATVRGVDFLEELKEKASENWRAAGVDPAKMRFATLRFCHVTDNREDALLFADYCRYQYRLARNLRYRQEELDKGLLPEIPLDDEPTLEQLCEHALIGDVETVAARIVDEVRRVGTFHSTVYMHIGDFPLAKALRSIERFGTEVIPAVRKALAGSGRVAAAE